MKKLLKLKKELTSKKELVEKSIHELQTNLEKESDPTLREQLSKRIQYECGVWYGYADSIYQIELLLK